MEEMEEIEEECSWWDEDDPAPRVPRRRGLVGDEGSELGMEKAFLTGEAGG